jgi:hypothetical protein
MGSFSLLCVIGTNNKHASINGFNAPQTLQLKKKCAVTPNVISKAFPRKSSKYERVRWRHDKTGGDAGFRSCRRRGTLPARRERGTATEGALRISLDFEPMSGLKLTTNFS